MFITRIYSPLSLVFPLRCLNLLVATYMVTSSVTAKDGTKYFYIQCFKQYLNLGQYLEQGSDKKRVGTGSPEELNMKEINSTKNKLNHGQNKLNMHRGIKQELIFKISTEYTTSSNLLCSWNISQQIGYFFPGLDEQLNIV